MDDYVVKKAEPVPPVMKAGLKEFLLELIVDADLVHFSIWISWHISLSILAFSIC
jgi:hypothetical protein